MRGASGVENLEPGLAPAEGRPWLSRGSDRSSPASAPSLPRRREEPEAGALDFEREARPVACHGIGGDYPPTMLGPRVFRCSQCGAFNRVGSLTPERRPVCGKCKADLDASGKAADVDGVSLERAIASSPAPVLVDFWAPWCAPCRAFAPVLDAFASEQAGRIVALRLNTQSHPAEAARRGIQAIPTLLLFQDGRETKRVSGALPLPGLRDFARTSP